jgi:hypothetical protein
MRIMKTKAREQGQTNRSSVQSDFALQRLSKVSKILPPCLIITCHFSSTQVCVCSWTSLSTSASKDDHADSTVYGRSGGYGLGEEVGSRTDGFASVSWHYLLQSNRDCRVRPSQSFVRATRTDDVTLFAAAPFSESRSLCAWRRQADSRRADRLRLYGYEQVRTDK